MLKFLKYKFRVWCIKRQVIKIRKSRIKNTEPPQQIEVSYG